MVPVLSLYPSLVLVSAGLCALAVRVIAWRIRRGRLPPGPPAHPIWGHVDLIKSPRLHLIAAEWVKSFGSLVALHFMGTNTVIINSAADAIELLDKRAATTSGRPREVMMGEVMGYDTSVALHQPDERFRKLRRVMASAMHATVVRSYQPIEVDNIKYMLRRMAGLSGSALTSNDKVNATSVNQAMGAGHPASSAQPMSLVREAVTRFILNVAYGHEAKPHDPFIGLIHAAMTKIREGRYPIVEALPWLVHLPRWLPGTRFLQVGAEGRALREAYAGRPFEQVRTEMRTGTARHSFVSNLLATKGGPDGATAHDQDLIKWTASVIFAGGSDTTVAAINTFLLMMAANPDVQRIAQEEITSVLEAKDGLPQTATMVGDEKNLTDASTPVPARLPGFEDRHRLPYLEAVFKEVMRFNPSLSMGLPHTVTQEETYQGYTFPVGTIIRANLWAILHDPTLYSSPHTFEPKRHLGPHADPNPLRYVFGFGRRICPGMHLATDQPWLAMAGILSAFNVVGGKGLIEEYKSRPWDMFEFNGMTSQPKTLPFSLVLRQGAEDLL
ncbi:O-methylsterigmatocystin oxidoreductase OS=Aspergillus flavus GN=ordA PE=3 SV=2 [Rhizoctonia solani AG-1 IB]|uniref:O-methylsterigmatocystin oxidoreductase n=1 Tax=Thanatephorus cucumeris (strain AG1-IB / isolate 7/3/14) TaxID=1108050 RepID=A0A0B7F7M5_THACB|nr:O-methylsterigmatocystin oxidoreductase OS=Aspergillus flavus GN=ordA PE=3 SV=2 [Rhizoctonia solani AG-1 IB]